MRYSASMATYRAIVKFRHVPFSSHCAQSRAARTTSWERGLPRAGQNAVGPPPTNVFHSPQSSVTTIGTVTVT